MTIKQQFDNLTNEQLNSFIKFNYIEDEWDNEKNELVKIELPNVTYKFAIITSQRRYDRYITKFYQDKDTGEQYRTDGIAKGGDNEWRDFHGSVHKITSEEYCICRDFWKLDFVSV